MRTRTLQEPLTDQVFLVLHDTFTGRPSVGPVALRCGVVGALLADLVLAGRLRVTDGRLGLAHARREEPDPDADYVLAAVAAQPREHTVAAWVGALADHFLDTVSSRLVAAGVVARGGRGLLGRGTPRFPAVDLLASARPRVHLEHKLRRPGDLDDGAAVCAAVLVAVGAERSLDVDGDRAAVRAGIAAAHDRLPPDVHRLLTGLEVATAAHSLPPSLRLRPSDA